MDIEGAEEHEERRWLLLLHLLFAVTLLIPSLLVAADRSAGWGGTLALAALLGAWYALLFARHADDVDGDRPLMLVYAAGCIVLLTWLTLRDGAYVLVLYALIPQLFSALSRVQAVVALAALVAGPPAVTRSFSLDDLFTIVAVVGVGLVVTALIEMFADRTERQREVIAQLEAARTENERLAGEAAAQARAAGVLAERQRLTHDIHDTLAQGFTSVVTQLEAAEQALAADARTAAGHIARAKRTARDGLTEARRTVEALRPAPLDGAELPEAVHALAHRWQDETTGVAVEVVVDGDPTAVEDHIEEAVLRITQEALANVARHAAADRAIVTLSYLHDVLLLDVQDDGRGFDPAVASARSNGSGYGLTSMRERAGLVGGRLGVESVHGEGTTITASVPLRTPARPGTRAGTATGDAR